MKRIKYLSLLLALTLLAGLLAGCGGSAAPADSAAPAESAAEAAGSAPEAAAPAEEAPAGTDSAAEPETPADSAVEAPAEEPEARVYGKEAITYTPVALPISEEPVTYTIWYGEPFSEYVSDPATDVAMFPLLQRLTNVSFEFSLFTMMNATERFQLLFAADDLPDIIQDAMSYYTGTIDSAVSEDEFLYNYADDLSNMPNLQSTLEAYP